MRRLHNSICGSSTTHKIICQSYFAFRDPQIYSTPHLHPWGEFLMSTIRLFRIVRTRFKPASNPRSGLPAAIKHLLNNSTVRYGRIVRFISLPVCGAGGAKAAPTPGDSFLRSRPELPMNEHVGQSDPYHAGLSPVRLAAHHHEFSP